MFSFENDVNCRLLKVGCKRLLDIDHGLIPANKRKWAKLLRTIVIGMVNRGEFDRAIEKISEILEDFIAKYPEMLTNNENISYVESFLIIVETLNITFVQNLIRLRLLKEGSINNIHSMPLRSITQWATIEDIPPLNDFIANRILSVCLKALPGEYREFPIVSYIELSPRYIIADGLLTACQYVYISNPNLIREHMSGVFSEEDTQTNIELAYLVCSNSEVYAEYIGMARRALPKMKLKKQIEVLHLTCGCLARSIISDPRIKFLSCPQAADATKSLFTWVDKLRQFKPLRNIRPHEAVFVSLVELQQMALNLNMEEAFGSVTKNELDKNSSGLSSMDSTVESTSLETNHKNGKPKYNNDNSSFSSATMSGSVENLKENSQNPKLTLANTKIFERVKIIIKREASGEKKSHNYIACCLYLTIIGFVSWAASNRPGGINYYGVALEVVPFTDDIASVCNTFSKNTRILFYCFCADMDNPLFLKLLPFIDGHEFFEVMRILQVFSKPEVFSDILSSCCEQYIKYFSKLVTMKHTINVCNILEMLIHIEIKNLPVEIITRVLHVLCNVLQSPPEYLNWTEHLSLYERYIEKIYHKVSPFKEDLINCLIPLLPDDAVISDYYKLYKIRNLYLYLRLMANGNIVISGKYLKSGFLGGMSSQSLRNFLMLCFCVEEKLGIPQVALKCLELIQGDIYQITPQRDLVSELLDSMEHPNPSIKETQYHMFKYLAKNTHSSFKGFNEVINTAIELYHNVIHSYAAINDINLEDASYLCEKQMLTHSRETQTNLLIAKVSTIDLESHEKRTEFYKVLFYLDSKIIESFIGRGSVISVNAVLECFETFQNIFQDLYQSSSKQHLLLDRAACFYWIIEALSELHVYNELTTNLCGICEKFTKLIHLPNTTAVHEKYILRFIGKSALYISEKNNGDMKGFDGTIHAIVTRKWLPDTTNELKFALTKILENYKVTDDSDLLNLIVHMSEFIQDENKSVSLISSLLRNNIPTVMHMYNSAISLNHICRASIYDSLAYELFSQVSENGALMNKTELVLFLLNHTPILEALCDVCSVAGNETLCPALLELFSSYSANAEKKLVEISIRHEVDRTTNHSELLRNNSVNMKIILEWIRIQSVDYIPKVLTPILGSLRSVTFRHHEDMDIIFSESLSRYEQNPLPAGILWLLKLLKNLVDKKFGENVTHTCIANLLCVRFICPAILTPHKYSVVSRAPAKDFSLILRKYAIFLQNNKDKLMKSLLKNVNYNDFSNNNSPDEDEGNLGDRKFLPSIKKGYTLLESKDPYSSSTRHVFHLLYRHTVDIRKILQSRGHKDLVFSMIRYLRLETTVNDKISTFDYEKAALNFRGVFCGVNVLLVTAQKVCTDKVLLNQLLLALKAEPLPIVIDCTEFIDVADLWDDTINSIAFSQTVKSFQNIKITVLNCPNSAILSLHKVSSLFSAPLETSYLDSCDFKDKIEDIPLLFQVARMAAADMNLSIGFDVTVRDTVHSTSANAKLYIGSRFLHLKKALGCQVIPFDRTQTTNSTPLTLKMQMDDMLISCGDIEILIEKVTPALIRILKLNIEAYQATIEGSQNDTIDSDYLSKYENENSAEGCYIEDLKNEETYNAHVLRASKKNYEEHIKKSAVLNSALISSGKILFLTLLDITHPLEIVRKKAIELYAAFHDTLVLQLNVQSLRESYEPAQVYTLASIVASSYPEMAISVATALASLGENITEKAVRIAAPWIPHIVLKSHEARHKFRTEVISPLLEATIKNPSVVGCALLEYFWPNLSDFTNITADLLLEFMKKSNGEERDAIIQIASNGIPATKPKESAKLAEVALARLYASLRTPGMLYAQKFQEHTEWNDIYNSALLFASVSVDYSAAERLLPDMGFVLFTLARVGDFQLRNAIHGMFINYISSLIKAPHLTVLQSQRLRSVRDELNSERSFMIFGVNKNNHTKVYDKLRPLSEELSYLTAEMSEYFGRLIWETIIGFFGGNLIKYQHARAAVALRIMEFIETLWPPLQRRCILGLIGAIKFYVPEYVVAKLLKVLNKILSFEEEELRDVQVELVNCTLRLFTDRIECVPETGKYQMHFFWVAIVALATSSEPIMCNAVRLLLKSVQIEHLRDSGDVNLMEHTFLKAKPEWIEDIAPLLLLDIPTKLQNFHFSIVQLLLRPLQKKESEELSIECFKILSNAYPCCILYTMFLYLKGEQEWLASRVPSGVLFDTNDVVLQWILKRLKLDEQNTVMSLGYAAYACAFTESPHFTQIIQRLLAIVEKIENRRVVCLVSPLLRPSILRLLEMEDPTIDASLVEWTSKIFSLTSNERKAIRKDSNKLTEILHSYDLSPYFDEKHALIPLNYTEVFTNNTRICLGQKAWLTPSEDYALNKDPYDELLNLY